MIVPGGQAGGGTGGINISWKDFFLGIWVGGRGPITENPFLGIPTFGQALEQDRAQWEESQLAQFGDQYSFFHSGPTGGFVADWSVISRTPGGDGPGSVVTSITPPSITATGASSAQSGKSGGPASSSKRRSWPRRKCKPGYRWNGHRCVRKD